MADANDAGEVHPGKLVNFTRYRLAGAAKASGAFYLVWPLKTDRNTIYLMTDTTAGMCRLGVFPDS